MNAKISDSPILMLNIFRLIGGENLMYQSREDFPADKFAFFHNLFFDIARRTFSLMTSFALKKKNAY